MAELVYEGKMNVEDVKRRHLQNGDKLAMVLESPWFAEEHQGLIPFLGRRCKVTVELLPAEQGELGYDGEEE